MWEFFDRLVNVSLPRVRDFKGVSAKAFDGRGNYSLGIREQIIFPEIDLRQGRTRHRHERHRMHHGSQRRRGASAARAPRRAVPAVRETRSIMMTDPDRRHAGPHPQCGQGAPPRDRLSVVEAQARDREGALGRGLSRRCACREARRQGRAGDARALRRVRAGPDRGTAPREPAGASRLRRPAARSPRCAAGSAWP